jgi:UbiD family decarboxylase
VPLAVVIGADPTIGLCSVSKVPYNTDEIAVAGGQRRAPVELVRCETVDLEVPASAEFVLEGEVDPEELEDEGPFGEFPGYMGAPGPGLVFHLTALTHRRDPIFQAFIAAVRYHATRRWLDVEYTNGGQYRYFDVPAEVHHEPRAAESIGTYLHQCIKPNCRYARLSPTRA